MTFPLARLDECSRIVSGATPSTRKAEFWNGDIPWVTPADLSKLDGPTISYTPRTITAAGLASCAAEVLPPNSVLFSSRAPIGHVAINTIPMATNQGFKSFVPVPNKLDANYLYHWLSANRSYLQGLGNGATFKEVSKAVVSRIQLPLPPPDDQRRIAAILDQADDLRRMRRKALECLERLRESYFFDMFGHPLSPRHEYQGATFEDVTTRITYGFTSPMTHLSSGIPILTAKNIRDGHIDLDNVHYADQAEYDALTNKSKPDVGDILVTKDGTIGRCAIVEERRPLCINQSVALVKPKTSHANPVYLLGYMLSSPVQGVFKAMSKGNAMAHLQITELAKLPIPLPSLQLQQAFATRVAAIDKLKGHHRSHLAKLDALFASLQHRAFRDEL